MKNNKLNWFQNVEHRAHPHPGLNWLTTTLSVPDVAKAIDFYTGVLEMVNISELEDEKTGDLLFARIRYRGNNFVLNKENWDFKAVAPVTSGNVPSFVFYLYVDDVKALIEEIKKEKEAEIISVPEMQFWGDLKARIKDPFGYIWDLAEKV
ncbi:putative glyoxalase superfamily protein PhnB [Flavobacterium sp. 270]|uniref:VOC family protein n=1 Tax=Flavobacterium sp. 270 TaxID=2512114 RepID=UPI00106507DC|nr:VOC family protein [Flavobacterium sp. 270]TDW51601.1 putative glyoxalase superfamily protein PhnB [Flavobacterium sp. 270]